MNASLRSNGILDQYDPTIEDECEDRFRALPNRAPRESAMPSAEVF